MTFHRGPTPDPTLGRYIFSVANVWRDEVPNPRENYFGMVLWDDGTSTMPVMCGHGGSGYVCQKCYYGMLLANPKEPST